MKSFRIMPTIEICDTLKEFCENFQVGERDLIVTNPRYFEYYFPEDCRPAAVVYVKNYGTGEPTDDMVDRIWQDIKDVSFDRLIGIGGGSILDIAKILVLKNPSPVVDLYDGVRPIEKDKELILIPTTCGTGSEVTSVSVLNVLSKGTKMGLQRDAEFADTAVLVTELLDSIPFGVFATSSLDAFVHASESFLSPKATVFSKMYSEKAIKMIINGYRQIADQGQEQRKELTGEFLLASCYAGIAFGNAGCAAVHAMSMPFSGAHHVAHGEANYAIFQGVFETYERIKPQGEIRNYKNILQQALDCEQDEVFQKLEKLFECILHRKPLHEYGVTEDELGHLADLVIEKQQRLTANNYVPLDRDTMIQIYQSLL